MSEFPVEEQLVYKCPRCGLEQMLLKETARIRELEERLAKRPKSQNSRIWHACVMKGEEQYYELRTEKEKLEASIAKAKAILKALKIGTLQTMREGIEEALDALEGK